MASTYGLRRMLSAIRRTFVADTRWKGTFARYPVVIFRGGRTFWARLGSRGVPLCLRRIAHFFTTFLSEPECPRKMRVGANSPSLWPTRFSVTYTGTQVLPLYTEIV